MKKILTLACCFLMMLPAFSQSIPYGSNPAVGKYIARGDVRLYYEVYGQGEPLLLLHGDALGYIDEFDQYIPILSKHFRVICAAMRGHGRSELGKEKFSYRLFAEDALAILRNETQDSAIIVGFSGGAITAYYLAAYFPASVRKVVALAGALERKSYRPEALKELDALTLEQLQKELPELIEARKKIMPQPERYGELIERLKDSWNQEIYVEADRARAIQCPVLTVGGDHDHYFDVDQFVRIYKTIPHSQLAIIPNAGHVSLIIRPEMFSAIVMPFLLSKK